MVDGNDDHIQLIFLDPHKYMVQDMLDRLLLLQLILSIHLYQVFQNHVISYLPINLFQKLKIHLFIKI